MNSDSIVTLSPLNIAHWGVNVSCFVPSCIEPLFSLQHCFSCTFLMKTLPDLNFPQRLIKHVPIRYLLDTINGDQVDFGKSMGSVCDMDLAWIITNWWGRIGFPYVCHIKMWVWKGFLVVDKTIHTHSESSSSYKPDFFSLIRRNRQSYMLSPFIFFWNCLPW